MNELISVIIPIYNAEKYIEKCLLSLQKQTYTDLEVLLIDDGSKDDSAKICQSFCAKDSRFKYIYQDNQGVSVARNRGLRLAKGTYIGFVDSDDWIEEDMYETLQSLLLQTSAEIAIISFSLDKNGMQQQVVDSKEIHFFDNKEAIKEMCLGHKFAGQLCNKLIRRELIDGIELPSGIAILEDMIFMLDAFWASNKIVFQDVHKYHYVINDTSATQSVKETLWTAQQASKIIFQRINERCPELIDYARKTGIEADWMIAEALYKNGKLNKENYIRLQADVSMYVNKETLRLLPKFQRIGVRWCKKSYRLFLFYKWLSKNNTVRKLLGKQV